MGRWDTPTFARMQSRGEAEARIGAALLDAADRRTAAMAVLAGRVEEAAAELDDKADQVPVELRSALRSLGRLRHAYDGLVGLEVKAAELILDLRGLMALAPVGTARRPFGYAPLFADGLLGEIARTRVEWLAELGKAERSAHPHLSAECASRLESATRVLAEEEAKSKRERERLEDLLGEFKAS